MRTWRLIPAHAGKTSTESTGRPCSAAHPRSRGENEEIKKRYENGEGSSPLTRGKRRRIVGLGVRVGLIPAHAGKTRAPRSCRPLPRAHPRSRGENRTSAARRRPVSGSSPLTRGKRAVRARPRIAAGLIPAHAGKTRRGLFRRRLRGAHPRSRGENLLEANILPRLRGSSPLTRGKRRARLLDGVVRRLIPAHAGKTVQVVARG